MRFRFTIFLIVANILLFFAIWSLEIKSDNSFARAADGISFTRLEISGKSLDKPRILSFENNKWRIISPINWPANLYAVNRIRNQLEFLSKETSFNIDEMKKYGHTLEEYGLKEPLFTIKYGGNKKMNSIRIGNTAPIGGRVYLFDEDAKKIVVVDKDFVESLILDVERLRNQHVFDIPRFEVSAFSIRMPLGDDKSGQANFKRVGLEKEGGKWKIATPISALADNQEVEAFLNDICQLTASSFEITDETGFGLIPTTITLQGTNRRRVLMLGGFTKDGKQIYAKLDDNPTIFTVDAEKFKNLGALQNMLRDKSFLRFDAADVSNIDISKDGKVLKLRKLTGGVWDVIGAGEKGDTLTAKADLARVNDLLSKLSNVRAMDFVNDLPGVNLEQYGIDGKSLKIQITQSNQTSRTLTIGSNYDYRGGKLSYACADGSSSVYGISRSLENATSTDFLYYRSKILSSLPEKAKITSIKIFRNKSGKQVYEFSAVDGDLKKAFSALAPRDSNAVGVLADCTRRFIVREYLPENFSKDGVKLGAETLPWSFRIEATVELRGAGTATETETVVWYATKARGGTTQYGGSEHFNSVFLLPFNMVDALRELTLEKIAPKQLDKPAPVPAVAKPMGNSSAPAVKKDSQVRETSPENAQPDQKKTENGVVKTAEKPAAVSK